MGKAPSLEGRRVAMTIRELFIASNEMEQEVVEQIGDDQWALMMPEQVTRRPMALFEVVRYHVWDSAWIPDGLAGETIEEVGDRHEHLLKLTRPQLRGEFARYTRRAVDAVRDLTDLDRIVHLTYGDFPAREYLQHNVSVRAFWSYDIAKLIGVDLTMADDVVRALTAEFSPVVEGYRRMGLFPPEVKAPGDASPQAKLLAMVGRD
jgi:hypothetical protein